MTVERWMTEEYLRYVKGTSGATYVVMLAQGDLFDAFANTMQALVRHADGPLDGPKTPTMPFKSARMYKLHHPGWTLVIEGPWGRQVSAYEYRP